MRKLILYCNHVDIFFYVMKIRKRSCKCTHNGCLGVRAYVGVSVYTYVCICNFSFLFSYLFSFEKRYELYLTWMPQKCSFLIVRIIVPFQCRKDSPAGFTCELRCNEFYVLLFRF